MFLSDGRVCLELRLSGCGRQAGKIRCSVCTAPVQNRCATKNNGGPFRARCEEHRQAAKNHIVTDDDVGREVPQNLLQALVLSRDGVDEYSLNGDAQPFRPRSSSGTTETMSSRSKSAPAGKAWNFAPIPSMRLRRALPDIKATSWPSAIKMRPIASSGLR